MPVISNEGTAMKLLRSKFVRLSRSLAASGVMLFLAACSTGDGDPEVESSESALHAPPPRALVGTVGHYVLNGREVFEFSPSSSWAVTSDVQAGRRYEAKATCLERTNDGDVWHSTEAWVLDASWTALGYHATGPLAGRRLGVKVPFDATSTERVTLVVRTTDGGRCNVTAAWVRPNEPTGGSGGGSSTGGGGGTSSSQGSSDIDSDCAHYACREHSDCPFSSNDTCYSLVRFSPDMAPSSRGECVWSCHSFCQSGWDTYASPHTSLDACESARRRLCSHPVWGRPPRCPA